MAKTRRNFFMALLLCIGDSRRGVYFVKTLVDKRSYALTD